jgi:hypothetical protein
MTTIESLAVAVGLSFDWMDMETLMTGLTGISRRNSQYLNPFFNPFVF